MHLNYSMGIIKQLFCKHEWIKIILRDSATLNLGTGLIHGGLTKEYKFCKKCNKKVLQVIDSPKP